MDEVTFFSRFERHAASGLEAVRSDETSLNYAELLSRVEAEAAALAAAGVGQGTVVGLSITDEIEHFVATLALLRVGAWQVAIASHDTPAIHEELTRRLGVTRLLTDGGISMLPGVEALPWPLPPGAATKNDEDQASATSLSTSRSTTASRPPSTSACRPSPTCRTRSRWNRTWWWNSTRANCATDS